MYNWEIDNTLKKYNYDIPSSIYLDICKSSPQITFVKRLNDREFKLVCKDTDATTREWIFSVYRDTK